ncbi:MAG: hypothetical protein PHP45_02165 [Elusimicrobiales bacterium]|nr:hypothetical protein [Elusimicrobiales bacterium]
MKLAAAALISLIAAATAVAGPPFFTDDPEPAGPGHWEFYLASQIAKTDDANTGTAPHIEVNYGALPGLQLHLIAPRAFNRPAGEAANYGYGDTELGVKYRFLGETASRPQLGVFPLAEIPTGNADRQLGSGHVQLLLPLYLQKSFGPWTTYGGGGYWINPGEGNKNWIYTGWLLQRILSQTLTLGGEIFHRTPSTADGNSSTGFNIGGQCNFTEQYHLLFSGGRDFSGPNNFTGYLALQYTL